MTLLEQLRSSNPYIGSFATEEAADELERLQQRVEVLEGALSTLLAKLDECQPHVANLSAIQFVRSGVQYTGPTYGEELEQARAALGD